MNHNPDNLIIPDATIRRFAQYHQLLQKLQRDGIKYISSSELGKQIGIESPLIRKDMNYTTIEGRPKIGYEVEEMIKGIEFCLGRHKKNLAFLIGVGNLGSAIINNKEFIDWGIDIVNAFDNDAAKIGKIMNDIEIIHIDRLAVLTKILNISLGIITVPTISSQVIADILVQNGIKAIWNLSSMPVKVPENIICENSNISQPIAIITRKLAFQNSK